MMCAQCEELEERVAYLEGELGLRMTARQLGAMRDAFGLSPKQARLVLALAQSGGSVVTRAQLEEALAGFEAEPMAASYISVYVKLVRERLASDAIENVWGQGYRMPAAWIAKVRAALPREAA